MSTTSPRRSTASAAAGVLAAPGLAGRRGAGSCAGVRRTIAALAVLRLAGRSAAARLARRGPAVVKVGRTARSAAGALACLRSGIATVAALALAATGTAQDAPPRDAGRIAVLLVGSRDAGPAVVLRLAAASAFAASGEERPLDPEGGLLDASALAGRQEPLASGEAPAGSYAGIRLVVEAAEPPSEVSAAPRALDVRLPLDFQVRAGETTTLLAHWSLPRALSGDGSLAADAWALRPAEETVRGLVLYVTDEAQDRLVAVNRATDQVFASVPVGRRPRGIAISDDGRRAYVAAAGDDALSVVDTSAQRVIDTLPLKGGCAPEDVALAEEGRRLAVSCPGQSAVAVVDTLTNALLGEVGLGRRPGRLATARDGRTVYALVPEGSQVVAIDVARVSAAGAAASVEAEPVDIAVDERGGTVLVTHARAPLLSVLGPDLRSRDRLTLARGAFGIAVERDGRRLYLSGGDAGGIALVSTDLGTMVRRWTTPPAYRLALDPDGRKVYATGGKAGTLLVLDRIAGRLLGTIRVGGRPADLAVVP